MKKLMVMVAVACSVVLIAHQAMAQFDTFTVTAAIPAATTAQFTVFKVLGDGTDPADWIEQSSGFTALDFGSLTLDPDFFIFLAAHFWVLDIGTIDGAGSPDVTVTYTEGTNPNSPSPGLGGHGVISFTRIEVIDSTTVPPTEDQFPLETQEFAGCNPCFIDDTDISGGFLRISMGLATGDTTLDEEDAVPFTTADAPAEAPDPPYSGSFLVSAVYP